MVEITEKNRCENSGFFSFSSSGITSTRGGKGLFLSIDYLKTGNERQSRAHEAILESRIFSELASFTPVLCGTIPIEVDIEESDLDIIMEVHDETALPAFAQILQLKGDPHEELLRLGERMGII